ncbi:MAG TPA: methyltransferase domain-containing protein [Natronosporangium sp.]
MVRTLDTEDLAERVRRVYRTVATNPSAEFHFETGRALAERLGYPAAELAAIPAGAVDSFAGVGYFLDLAALRPGETVVDLGSGSGMDSFLAARQVGSGGRVIGVDMTDDQLTKARRLATEAGIGNVWFQTGRIERLPLEDAVADVMISNGVINLSPSKPTVFAEAARVLRPGGRLALADIVTERPLPAEVTGNAALWAACIGGAAQASDYLIAITQAGFEVEEVRENRQYRFRSTSALNATARWGVKSVSMLARRPSRGATMR